MIVAIAVTTLCNQRIGTDFTSYQPLACFKNHFILIAMGQPNIGCIVTDDRALQTWLYGNKVGMECSRCGISKLFERQKSLNLRI